MLAFSAPAWATRQCPPEFGPKDPLVDMLGWLVVAVGIVVGVLLFAWLVRRSRGMRWALRCAVVVLGVAGMLVVWVGGLALAFASFFLQC
ncbi:hypothetical protein JR065_09115 [Xanthomonas sp. AmX2]|nr:hypothetical protein [Xanthomonas sp.]